MYIYIYIYIYIGRLGGGQPESHDGASPLTKDLGPSIARDLLPKEIPDGRGVRDLLPKEIPYRRGPPAHQAAPGLRGL